MAPLSSSLRLRRLVDSDAAAFDSAHRATTDYEFGLGYTPGMAFGDFVALHERFRCGIDMPDGRVPATFLVAEVDGDIVGRSSVRHELNDFLHHEGGHIGYCIVPEHRRRGHATAVLVQSVVMARAVGIDRVLVCCNDDNESSASIIERCGGQLENIVDGSDAKPVRRYWID